MGESRGGARCCRDQFVLAGVIVQVVDAVDQDGCVVRQRHALQLALERRALQHAARPGRQVAPESPLGVARVGVRVAELARAIDDQADAVVSPGDVLGIADLTQEEDLLAVRPYEACRVVEHLTVGVALTASEESVQRTVGAVLCNVFDDRLERRSHRPSHVDDEAVEIVMSEVVPERELADPS
jgi:hypothetical protein